MSHFIMYRVEVFIPASRFIDWPDWQFIQIPVVSGLDGMALIRAIDAHLATTLATAFAIDGVEYEVGAL